MTKLYTTIRPTLYRKALFQGCLWGISGALLLVLSSLFVHREELQHWGPVVGLVSLLMIGYGFRPFMRLKRMETKPVPLEITEEGFVWKNIRIPRESVAGMHYVDDGDKYGIEIAAKTGDKLFLPYYSKRSFETLLKSQYF